MHLKMSSGKWRPFCLGLNVLIIEAKWGISASVNQVTTGSGNGLSPVRCQAIIWSNGELFWISPQSEIKEAWWPNVYHHFTNQHFHFTHITAYVVLFSLASLLTNMKTGVTNTQLTIQNRLGRRPIMVSMSLLNLRQPTITSKVETSSCWLQWYSVFHLQYVIIYRQTSNISCTLVDNKIDDHWDVVGTSLVGAAPTTSSFST